MSTQEQGMDWTSQGGSAPEIYQSFLVPGMFTPFAERLLDEVGVDPGARVLDIACGTGVVCRAAARRAGATGSVTGVDLGPAMLAVAETQPVEEGAAVISYVEGDAESLPVKDVTVDVTTCHHGLQFFPDRARAVAEMRRVLRPGGRAGIGCWTGFDETPIFVSMVSTLTRHLGAALGDKMRAPFGLSDPEELSGLLRGAGFSDIRVEAVTLPVTFASHEGFARLAIGAGPLAPLFAQAAEEAQAAIVDDLTQELTPFATPQGTVSSQMTSLIGTGTA